MKSFVSYRQQNAMDCGPTCLRMVLKHHGRQVSSEAIRKTAQFNKRGVSLLNLSEAAEKYGFHTLSAKITFEQLMDDAPLPCILFWENYHFVVLTPSSNKKKLVVADPAMGIRVFTKETFLKHWISPQNTEQDRGVSLLLTPSAAFYEQEDEKPSGITWPLLRRYVSRYKPQVFQLMLGLLVGSILQLVFPFLTQSIVDTGINTQNLHFIQIVLIAQFTLFFSRTVIEFIRSRILLYVSTHVNLAILSDFWAKLMRLPLSFFDIRHTGDTLQRISDNKRIETFITGSTLQALFSLFNLIVFSVVLLLYSGTIYLIFFICSVAYLLWILLFLRYRRELDHRRFQIASRESATTIQLIYGMQEIKLNNAEHLKRWEWEGVQASLFKLNFRSLSLNQYQQAGAFFINEGKNILITYMAAKAVLMGELTLGVMLAVQYIIGQLNGPIEQLISFTQQAQDAKISFERLNEIHQMQDEEPEGTSFSHDISASHNIQLSNLNFAYPGASDQPVLKDLTVEFPGGKITAIVGTSGSGKTTLLKLIQKFYTDYTGELKIGESNLKYLSPYYWRSISGSVMQDGYIFSDTIARNIAVGDEMIDYDRVVHACKIANIMAFVESLPLGFNTKIGAEGNGISAGQKQRILIARAVYKDPKFIFFDEATNALDANNEKAIIENLNDFFKGKTVIIVAHRLSTVKNAHKIVVLENGAIVESGNHASLIAAKNKYYELVRNQLELENELARNQLELEK